MERVAFLIEATNERLGCLLNPASLLMQRTAGVQPRTSAGGHFTGSGLRDHPLLYTGGGTTILELQLLFDVNLAGSSIQANDVRDLTAPLWNLAENTQSAGSSRRPPLVRFVWGKSWNIPGVIVAVAERLEAFADDGVPQRSWLSMRLWRVDDTPSTHDASQPADLATLAPSDLDIAPGSISAEHTQTHLVSAGERLDTLAARYYSDQSSNDQGPARWRMLASFNDLHDPFDLSAGTVLQVPPASAVGGAS